MVESNSIYEVSTCNVNHYVIWRSGMEVGIMGSSGGEYRVQWHSTEGYNGTAQNSYNVEEKTNMILFCPYEYII